MRINTVYGFLVLTQLGFIDPELKEVNPGIMVKGSAIVALEPRYCAETRNGKRVVEECGTVIHMAGGRTFEVIQTVQDIGPAIADSYKQAFAR